MPLYEYQCKKCHHFFERIRKFSDPTIKKCPECGGPVEQTITAPAVQFKGSGWYVTDYPKKSSASAASGDSGSKTESTEKTDTKDKTESAAKKEDKPKTETSSKKTEKK
jgi:putative FmdB family regulatory protein